MRDLSAKAKAAIGRHHAKAMGMTAGKLRALKAEKRMNDSVARNARLSAVFDGSAEASRMRSLEISAYLRRRANRTSFYTWLVPRGRDVEVRIAAAKFDRAGGPLVKEVFRARICGDTFEVCDMSFYRMSGYKVDWSAEGAGRKPEWAHNGKWETEKYDRKSGLWKIHCTVLNIEALQKSKRFKYCSWSSACGHILDYLKAYAEHPRIELLAKCGAGRFATLTGFVKRMEKDKAFMRFFSANLEEINTAHYLSGVVTMAYVRGITLEAAWKRINAIRRFRGGKLPKTVDTQRAAAYIDGQRGASDWEYCHYLGMCLRLGKNLSDTKVAFPKSFARQSKLAADLCAEMDRKKQAKLRAEMTRKMRAVAMKFTKLESIKGPFVARLPRSESDLKKEGARLHHCVGKMAYADKIARGECLIVFVRKASRPGAPFVTCELDKDAKKVLQCYGNKNSKPAADVMAFINSRLIKASRRKAS